MLQKQPERAKSFLRWSNVLFWVLILSLFILACWMRWHTLGVLFDRDSYDEGVYWQSLRSMATGHVLYGQVFYSQPPAFLLTVFPIYLAFGQSILAARLGVALISLLGLLGAIFVGKVMRGNLGILVALLLLLVNPLYLSKSQTLQADAPAAAFMLLTVGLVYLWWRYPTGRIGYMLAILTTVSLVWSIFCKLFGLADLVPVCLLALAHLWRVWQQPLGRRLAYSGSLLAGLAALLITALLVLLPFRSSFPQLWDQVISFHTAAKVSAHAPLLANKSTLLNFLRTPLGLLALYGSVLSLARRDWLVLPLLGWFLAVFVLLLQQSPLFTHHLVTLVPPLVLLALTGIGPLPFIDRVWRISLADWFVSFAFNE